MKRVGWIILLAVFGCQSAHAGDLPDPATTPGAVDARVNQANIWQTICVHGYTARVRPPLSYTNRLKRRQMADAHLPGHIRDYEEDHLISLELGGSPSDPRNLWPEPYAGPWGARTKDRLENRLHRLVCGGRIRLADAQQAISRDWIAAYRRYVGVRAHRAER
ncbi:MAG TPA: hypothetical protein VNH42_01740 [Mariprofundaceae bacterium]|nr:hypothetical protein [Mariprofundaceae bacterium]